MIEAPAVRTSVIVVSRHRPQALARCLVGISQLDHPNFEVIVVADPVGLAATEGLPIKQVAFDLANISAARNAGLAVAAGDVVAFIDDDAVPEPTWLSRLTAPFATPQVAAAGGFVRGRNGFSYQWRARRVDALGQDHPLQAPSDKVSLHPAPPAGAIRTEGTNCAFRRDILAALGGFDPAYRFFLDETDLNMRFARAGHVTAIVPGAEVHHGFAPSARRAPDRAPRDLHDVGASMAVFWRRHAPARADLAAAEARLIQNQRFRLVRHMIAGGLEPREVESVLKTLRDGLTEGKARALPALSPMPLAPPPFLPFPSALRPGRMIAGRFWQAAAKRRQAARAAADGAIVTLILLSPTARPHRMRFDPHGFWEQAGGLWGRSDRDAPTFAAWSFHSRIKREIARLSRCRPIDDGPGG